MLRYDPGNNVGKRNKRRNSYGVLNVGLKWVFGPLGKLSPFGRDKPLFTSGSDVF